MKKITFLIATLAILMASCDKVNNKPSKSDSTEHVREEIVNTNVLNEIQTTPEHHYTENYNYVKVYAFEEDGCKYIVATSTTHDFRGGTSVNIIHAASCTNPIHDNGDNKQ